MSITNDDTKAPRLANSDDITVLLKNLPALPCLRAARVIAVRRSVGPVDMCCMSHLEHVAIACKELELDTARGWNPTKDASFNVVVEKICPKTVGSKSI